MPDNPFPFPVKYSPRDASRARGSLVKNCFEGIDPAGQPYMEKRAGQILSVNGAGSGQGVFTQDGQVYSIAGDGLYKSPLPAAKYGWFNANYDLGIVDGNAQYFQGKLWYVVTGHVYSYVNIPDVGDSSPVDHGTCGMSISSSSFHFKLVLIGSLLYLFVIPNDHTNSLITSYSTPDGTNWTLVGSSSPFTGRSSESVIVFGGAVYLLGGEDFTTTTKYQQIWKTTDYINWTLYSSTMPWGSSASVAMALVVFNNKVYKCGCDANGQVYSSSDLLSWTTLGTVSLNGYSTQAAIAYGTRIYFISQNDFQSSSDGNTWINNYYRPLAGYNLHSMVAMGDRFYVPGTTPVAFFFNPTLTYYGPISPTITLLTALTPSSSGKYFTFSQTPSTSFNGFFFKSTADAYIYNIDTSTLTKVTDADYPATTVPGFVLLDGTYYVMTTAGQIYGSALNDPTSWTALNVISCVAEPDGGIALARLQNYVAAFGAYTIEFFYDAGVAAPSSPLLPVQNAMVEIGCAAGGSVAGIENTLLFIGVGRQMDRSIYIFNGTVPQKVSTPAVDTILFADDMAGVVSYCCKIKGQSFYVLTLPTTGITLVYCLDTKAWYEWTSTVAGSPRTLSAGALTYANGQATVVDPGHGYADASIILVSGASETGSNGYKIITLVDTNTYTFPTITTTSGTATGTITTTGYTETYFLGSFAAGLNINLVTQSRLTGDIQVTGESTYLDGSLPIFARLRSTGIDGGTSAKKYFGALTLMAESLSSFVYLRTTKDDYQTWSSPRPVSLATERKRFNRLGAAYRQAFEILHCDSTNFHVDSILLTIDKGTD